MRKSSVALTQEEGWYKHATLHRLDLLERQQSITSLFPFPKIWTTCASCFT